MRIYLWRYLEIFWENGDHLLALVSTIPKNETSVELSGLVYSRTAEQIAQIIHGIPAHVISVIIEPYLTYSEYKIYCYVELSNSHEWRSSDLHQLSVDELGLIFLQFPPQLIHFISGEYNIPRLTNSKKQKNPVTSRNCLCKVVQIASNQTTSSYNSVEEWFLNYPIMVQCLLSFLLIYQPNHLQVC